MLGLDAGQVPSVQCEQILEVEQQPFRQFRRTTVLGQVCDNLALASNVILPLTNVAFGHLELSFERTHTLKLRLSAGRRH